MKYYLCLPLFLWVVYGACPFNNQIYFNGIYGLVYQPIGKAHDTTQSYDPTQAHYLAANIGWHGIFESKEKNNSLDTYNFGILTEAGYYHYIDREDRGILKISAGLSLGQYFVWYVKPSLFYEFDNAGIGMSASIGLKINTFINDIAIGFGVGSDIPIPGAGNGMYPETSAGFYATFDMIYDINRVKKKNLKK